MIVYVDFMVTLWTFFFYFSLKIFIATMARKINPFEIPQYQLHPEGSR